MGSHTATGACQGRNRVQQVSEPQPDSAARRTSTTVPACYVRARWHRQEPARRGQAGSPVRPVWSGPHLRGCSLPPPGWHLVSVSGSLPRCTGSSLPHTRWPVPPSFALRPARAQASPKGPQRDVGTVPTHHTLQSRPLEHLVGVSSTSLREASADSPTVASRPILLTAANM